MEFLNYFKKKKNMNNLNALAFFLFFKDNDKNEIILFLLKII